MKKEPQYIEYEDGTRVLLDEDDTPEMSSEWFRHAKRGLDGLAELLGEEFVAPLKSPGRPVSEHPKEKVTVRLDHDILAALRGKGRGWQTRLNAFLRGAMLEGKL